MDKEMMKRERYIYQRGGDQAGWGAGKKDKLFHNNHRKHSPSDSPGGPRRPPRRLSREADAGLEGAGALRADQTWAIRLGDELIINNNKKTP